MPVLAKAFTDTGADFQQHMVGWLISVNVEEFSYLEIVDVDELGTWINVKGDADALAASGDRYWLFAPPHVDPGTGAIKGSFSAATFEPAYSSSYLWGLYRYMPPMAGFYVDPDGEGPIPEGVYGRQVGTNQSGSYFATHRWYDPSTGQWTTPDPASTPWWRLQDYVHGTPLSSTDPTGNGVLGILGGVAGGLGIVAGGVAIWTWSQHETYDEKWVRKQADIYQRAFKQIPSKLAAACKEGAKDCPEKCCENAGTTLGTHLALRIYEAVVYSKQTGFGTAGNIARNTVRKGLEDTDWQPGKQVEEGVSFNCGDWTHYLFDNYKDLRKRMLENSSCCECALGEGHYMLTEDEDHNYFRICFGKECVIIDPWEEGHSYGERSDANGTEDTIEDRAG